MQGCRHFHVSVGKIDLSFLSQVAQDNHATRTKEHLRRIDRKRPAKNVFRVPLGPGHLSAEPGSSGGLRKSIVSQIHAGAASNVALGFRSASSIATLCAYRSFAHVAANDRSPLKVKNVAPNLTLLVH